MLELKNIRSSSGTYSDTRTAPVKDKRRKEYATETIDHELTAWACITSFCFPYRTTVTGPTLLACSMIEPFLLMSHRFSTVWLITLLL